MAHHIELKTASLDGQLWALVTARGKTRRYRVWGQSDGWIIMRRTAQPQGLYELYQIRECLSAYAYRATFVACGESVQRLEGMTYAD